MQRVSSQGAPVQRPVGDKMQRAALHSEVQHMFTNRFRSGNSDAHTFNSQTAATSYRSCSGTPSEEPCTPCHGAEHLPAALLEQELGRQRVKAAAAERALVESYKANELMAVQVQQLQEELSQVRAAAQAQQAAAAADAREARCSSQQCSAELWRQEATRLKSKVDQRSVELLLEQQRLQTTEQQLQEREEQVQALSSRLKHLERQAGEEQRQALERQAAASEQQLQEKEEELLGATRRLKDAEQRLQAAHAKLLVADQQRQEAVSRAYEHARQLQSVEKQTADASRKAFDFEKSATLARSAYKNLVRQVMIVVVKAAVAIESLNKALKAGPDLADTPLGAAIASNVEVLGALIALRCDLVQGRLGPTTGSSSSSQEAGGAAAAAAAAAAPAPAPAPAAGPAAAHAPVPAPGALMLMGSPATSPRQPGGGGGVAGHLMPAGGSSHYPRVDEDAYGG